MLHVYFGEGKGKTTAAAGLALRAACAGVPATFVQFLKDGSSAEVRGLEAAGVACLDDGPLAKFTFRMTPGEREASRALHDARLAQAAGQAAAAGLRLVVLDECLGSLAAGLVDEGALKGLCRTAAGSESFELALTGRPAPAWLLELADYATEMRCERHPYARGLAARAGVEY